MFYESKTHIERFFACGGGSNDQQRHIVSIGFIRAVHEIYVVEFLQHFDRPHMKKHQRCQLIPFINIPFECPIIFTELIKKNLYAGIIFSFFGSDFRPNVVYVFLFDWPLWLHGPEFRGGQMWIYSPASLIGYERYIFFFHFSQ